MHDGDYRRLRGAVADANRVKKYLIEKKRVDPHNIKDLLNKAATREEIIKQFKLLATNSNIKKDDPILIYFAGHGASVPIPSWREHFYADGQTHLEMICPVDLSPSASNPLVIPGIPDFTISRLLKSISVKKGNNIVNI